jgi:hypothetical protein
MGTLERRKLRVSEALKTREATVLFGALFLSLDVKISNLFHSRAFGNRHAMTSLYTKYLV